MNHELPPLSAYETPYENGMLPSEELDEDKPENQLIARFPFLAKVNTEFPLGSQQVEAIDSMITWYTRYRADPTSVKPRFILTGFAGTGKTTVVKPFLDATGIDISGTGCGALSGKASKILNNRGLPSYTLHSQIYTSVKIADEARTGIQMHIDRLNAIAPRFTDDEEYTRIIRKSIKLKKEEIAAIDAGEYSKYKSWFILDPESVFFSKQLIVVDEASMIDKVMEIDILSFGVPTVFIGDPMQLKPFSDIGSVLYTMRKIPVLPDFHMTEIHRQARENPIIQLSMDIREGKMPKLGKMGDSVMVVQADKISSNILISAEQVICGTNSFRQELNQEVRQHKGITNPFPVANEKLICKVNNPQKMLFNGLSMETISDSVLLNPALGIYSADYRTEDGIEEYDALFNAGLMTGTLHKDRISARDRREHIFADFGYAITAHNSQGSTYRNAVVFADPIGRSREDLIRWWYTATTRASHKLAIGL